MLTLYNFYEEADSMDLSKLSLSDKIIGGAAAALLIASFLPWFEVSVAGFGGGTGNGWDVGFFWAGVPVLLGLVMAAQIGISNFSPDTKLPEIPVTWGKVHLGAGALAAAIVLLKLLIGEDAGIGGLGVEVNRAFGLFLAVIAAGALAYGGFLKFQEEQKTSATPPSV